MDTKTRRLALLEKQAGIIARQQEIFDAASAANKDLTDAEAAEDDVNNERLNVIAEELMRLGRHEARIKLLDTVDATGVVISDMHNRAEDEPWASPAKPHGFGNFLHAVFNARMGFGTDARLLKEAAAQGAGSAQGADGGFLVPITYAQELLLNAAAGDVWSRVNRKTMSAGQIDISVVDETSRATGSRFGGVQGYWVDQGVASTATKPAFNKLSFKPVKVAALGYSTEELLADVPLFESIMKEAFYQELRFLVEDSIIEGTGGGQPLGILNAAATISVAKETGQLANTVVKENIDKMWSRMPAKYRKNAIWFINQDIEPQLDSLSMVVGTGGMPVYLPPGGIADVPLARLKARPVVPIEYCPTLGTVGDILLVDPMQYWLFDKGDAKTATSMHVAFTTDEQAFRVTYRVDGQPNMKAALTPFKGTNTQSAFISLATRA